LKARRRRKGGVGKKKKSRELARGGVTGDWPTSGREGGECEEKIRVGSRIKWN